MIKNLRPLGAGGYGDVFLGDVSETGQTVVVKFLRDYRVPHARRAFEREVRILRRQMNGMVPLLFADMNAQPPYYTMPCLNGTLTRYAGRLTESQINAVATRIASTILSLHSSGETHGDIKPDNILVSAQGDLHVGDPLGSGVAFTLFFSDKHGGTPGYWAPEVRIGQAISRTADAYSFGATLCHLMTGQRPQDNQRFDNLCREYPAFPTICEIITVCCQLDPCARPSMQEVLRMLRGDTWKFIRAERARQQEAISDVLSLGALVLCGVLLANLSKTSVRL